jgi:DNA-binding NtrC family response regulator
MKVLYMSGYTNNAIVHHGVLDDGINFIQKPFAINDLAKKIDEVLNGPLNR